MKAPGKELRVRNPRFIDVPSDVEDFGVRHKIPRFAEATYVAGYIDGWRDCQKKERP